MKRAILIFFIVHVCSVFEAVAQGNIDAIVKDALQSTFGVVPKMERISASMYMCFFLI